MLPIKKIAERLPAQMLLTMFKGQTLELAKTLTEKTIRDYASITDPIHVVVEDRTMPLTGEQYARYEIGKCLRLCYGLVELREENLPSNEEAKLIAHNVQKYFGYLTVKDIFYAFELAANQVLNINIEHYGKIGVKYISAILKEYSTWRVKKIKEIEKTLEDFNKDLLGNYLENCSKNEKAIRLTILTHYKEWLSQYETGDNGEILSRPKSGYMRYKCFDIMKLAGMIEVPQYVKELCIEQVTKNQRKFTDYEKAMGYKHDTVADAKVLSIYHFFEEWEMEEKTVDQLSDELAKTCCIVEPDHWEKIKKYEAHNERRKTVQKDIDGFSGH